MSTTKVTNSTNAKTSLANPVFNDALNEKDLKDIKKSNSPIPEQNQKEESGQGDQIKVVAPIVAGDGGVQKNDVIIQAKGEIKENSELQPSSSTKSIGDGKKQQAEDEDDQQLRLLLAEKEERENNLKQLQKEFMDKLWVDLELKENEKQNIKQSVHQIDEEVEIEITKGEVMVSEQQQDADQLVLKHMREENEYQEIARMRQIREAKKKKEQLSQKLQGLQQDILEAQFQQEVGQSISRLRHFDRDFYNDENHQQKIKEMIKDRRARELKRSQNLQKNQEQLKIEQKARRQEQINLMQLEKKERLEKLKKDQQEKAKLTEKNQQLRKETQLKYKEKLDKKPLFVEKQELFNQKKQDQEFQKKQILAEIKQIRRPMSPTDIQIHEQWYQEVKRVGVLEKIEHKYVNREKDFKSGNNSSFKNQSHISKSTDKYKLSEPWHYEQPSYRPLISQIIEQEEIIKQREELEKKLMKNRIFDRRNFYSLLIKEAFKPKQDPFQELEMRAIIQEDSKKGRKGERNTIFVVGNNRNQMEDMARIRNRGNQYLMHAKLTGKSVSSISQIDSKPYTPFPLEHKQLSQQNIADPNISWREPINDKQVKQAPQVREKSTNYLHQRQVQEPSVMQQSHTIDYSQGKTVNSKSQMTINNKISVRSLRPDQHSSKFNYLPEIHQQFGDVKINQLYIHNLEKSLNNQIDHNLKEKIQRIKIETDKIEQQAQQQERLLEFKYNNDDQREELTNLYLASIKAKMTLLDAQRSQLEA